MRDMGVENGAPGTKGIELMVCYNFSAGLITQMYSNYITDASTSSFGFFIGTRTAANLLKQYRNSTNTSTSTLNSTVTSLSDLGSINIGRVNPFISEYSNRECAFASIGDGLTDTEASNFYTAVQTYQTALGRQV